MSQAGKFWDKIAVSYSKAPIKNEETYHKKLRVTREYFRPEMEVLEIGCGTGSTAIAHAPYVKHILAVDISSKMLEIAENKAAADNVKNITFQQSTIDDIDFGEQSFDAVLGLSILHLLENAEAVIARVHHLLKPGGVFVTSTACLGDAMMLWKIILPLGRFFRLIPLVRIFTRKQLEGSFIDAGFEIEYQWLPGKKEAVFIVAKKAK